jgi:tetratricopeptide (TPR) repeat protein
MKPAIDLAARCEVGGNPHTELELIQTEAMWRTESDIRATLDRSLACASDESAPAAHRARAALLAAMVADNVCSYADLKILNEVATALTNSSGGARSDVLAVRLIYETVLGSLDQASALGEQLIQLERATESVRGLSQALRFSSVASRMLGDFDRALRSVKEALELAERHHLFGEAASAADLTLTIHLEREDLTAAGAWITRCEGLASRVGARYPRVSLAINKAIYALHRGDADAAMRCIELHAINPLSDPVLRQRMLHLSILARVYVARNEHDRLAEILPSLKDALERRRSTGVDDFHIASLAKALEALGDERRAVEYARMLVGNRRRGQTSPSSELQRFLQL